jgi:Protein of unknown function (DUF3500)
MADAGMINDDETARREVASRMVEAALEWLDTLDAEQRRISQGAVPADDREDNERRRWFYTPTDHGGLTIHQQRPAQQRAVMRLISTGLSPAAYVTVATIMGLENVLDYVEGFKASFNRERGRDPGMYYLRVFGEPGDKGLWGWRFGGHHVSLNNLVIDGVLVATTPCFLGANPAMSPLLGGAVNRPLGRIEDLGRDLVRSLPPELATRAILLPNSPSDFVTINLTYVTDGKQAIPLAGMYRDERNPDPVEEAKLRPLNDVIRDETDLSEADQEVVAYSTEPKGVPAADFDAEQREMLRALLGTCLDRAPTGLSPLGSYDDEDALNAVHFAWAGATAPGEPHYYRLQDPRLLIEWDNTQNNANHAHSVWRDPTSDFGLDVLARHRAAHHR